MTIIFHIYITRINANNNTIRRKKALSNTLNEIIYRADWFEIQGQSFQLFDETWVAHNQVPLQATKWGVQEVYHNSQQVYSCTTSLLLVLCILHTEFHVPVWEIPDSGKMILKMIIQIPMYDTETFPFQEAPKQWVSSLHNRDTNTCNIYRHCMAIEFMGYSIHQSIEWFVRS